MSMDQKNVCCLREISIKNFLGYVNPQVIEIAIPNGKIGSGLTIIIGEINSGKSSIFEAVKKLQPYAKFLPKERNKEDPIIEFTDKDGLITKIERGNKATVKISGEGIVTGKTFELIPARRHWKHTFHANNISDYSSYLSNSSGSHTKYEVDQHLGGLLEKIAENTSLKSNFNEMLKFLFPGFSDWEIDCDNNGSDIVNYHIVDNEKHDTSLIGDGLISLFRICAHLISTNDNLIPIIKNKY